MTIEEVTLRVVNVQGLVQYMEIVKYLRALSPVTQVDISRIEANI